MTTLTDELSPEALIEVERLFEEAMAPLRPYPHLRVQLLPEDEDHLTLRCDHCAASVLVPAVSPPADMGRRGADFVLHHGSCIKVVM